MTLTTIKTVFIIILTSLLLIITSTLSHGASFKFALENQGKTWQLGNSHHLGLLGFTDLTASSTFTLSEIINHIDLGTPVKFYAGPGMPSLVEYTELTPETVFDYTAIPGQQSVNDAFYIEFDSNKVHFEHFGFTGGKTLVADGKLGSLDSVPAPIPIPATWMIAVTGLMFIILAKYKLNPIHK
ncbi:hypothetical protein [Maridesulfovibrio zosterae]|uniref:hypothetical protein n=1 Tax=Maridesulfovibrio zosterae TaxID=82171 RepID=UPI000481F129|nr:hypothetical protein [Maridesulfovibrio zosterae]